MIKSITTLLSAAVISLSSSFADATPSIDTRQVWTYHTPGDGETLSQDIVWGKDGSCVLLVHNGTALPDRYVWLNNEGFVIHEFVLPQEVPLPGDVLQPRAVSNYTVTMVSKSKSIRQTVIYTKHPVRGLEAEVIEGRALLSSATPPDLVVFNPAWKRVTVFEVTANPFKFSNPGVRVVSNHVVLNFKTEIGYEYFVQQSFDLRNWNTIAEIGVTLGEDVIWRNPEPVLVPGGGNKVCYFRIATVATDAAL